MYRIIHRSLMCEKDFEKNSENERVYIIAEVNYELMEYSTLLNNIEKYKYSKLNKPTNKSH